jgi:hypothetical protein
MVILEILPLLLAINVTLLVKHVKGQTTMTVSVAEEVIIMTQKLRHVAPHVHQDSTMIMELVRVVIPIVLNVMDLLLQIAQLVIHQMY